MNDSIVFVFGYYFTSLIQSAVKIINY